MRVTWQIGVTSMNALGGAVCDDYGVCHRTRGFRLEGPLPAKSGRLTEQRPSGRNDQSQH